MKRFVSILLILILVFSFTACSKKTSDNTIEETTTSSKYPKDLIGTWGTNLGKDRGGFVDADNVEHFVQQYVTFNDDFTCTWNDYTGSTFEGSWSYDDDTNKLLCILNIPDSEYGFKAYFNYTTYLGKTVLKYSDDESTPQYYYQEKDFEIITTK